MTFYGKMQDMECLSGDTLPVFDIQVDAGSDADSIDSCTMHIIVAKHDIPQIAVINKSCELSENIFSVQIDSNDTSSLAEGTYDMHFLLKAPNGKRYRKLFGSLYVHTAAKGVT